MNTQKDFLPKEVLTSIVENPTYTNLETIVDNYRKANNNESAKETVALTPETESIAPPQAPQEVPLTSVATGPLPESMATPNSYSEPSPFFGGINNGTPLQNETQQPAINTEPPVVTTAPFAETVTTPSSYLEPPKVTPAINQMPTEPTSSIPSTFTNLSEPTMNTPVSNLNSEPQLTNNQVDPFTIPSIGVPPIVQAPQPSTPVTPLAKEPLKQEPIEFNNIFEPNFAPTAGSMGMTPNFNEPFSNTNPSNEVPVNNVTPFFNPNNNTPSNNFTPNPIPITNPEPTTLFGAMQRAA